MVLPNLRCMCQFVLVCGLIRGEKILLYKFAVQTNTLKRLTCTKHVFSNRVIIVDLLALLIGHDRNLGLVQVLCTCIVQVLALSPSDYCALGSHGELLVLLRQTGESNVRGWDDLLW